MHIQTSQPGGLWQYLIPAAIFVLVFGLRMRRMSKERPLRLETLWIVPAIYLALVAATFVATPPRPLGWAIAAAGLAAGAALGWQRGRAMRITVDPATHRLNHRASPLAMLILVALVVVRMVMREEGARLHLDAVLVTDTLLAFALGLFAATRAEMYLRGRRLLDQAMGSPAV